MKRLLARILRKLLRWVSPPPAPPSALMGPPAEPATCRDVQRFEVEPGLVLSVFWKNLSHGYGPGLTVYFHQFEIIAFDCFGQPGGHFHIHMHYGSIDTGRLLLPEPDIPAQIERCFFELRHNLLHWQQIHAEKRVRDFRVDPVALDRALETVAPLLRAYHQAALEDFARKALSVPSAR